ncbi:MAG: NAD-dependent epimerase/dehydratase family protein [Nitrosarchaeum sp.]|nr:NAD-dependent epimerase/dehydratase family protein [Nitrosarchaeum sp.]
MKILVTGASGFIGSHLMKYLSRNNKVHGLSRSKKSQNIFQISLSDKQKLARHMKKNKYDLVIHLAASLEESVPFDMFIKNCVSTANVLECCAETNVAKVVFSSSQLVYGKSIYLPIDEDHPKNPINNYALSKLICEEICKMYYNTYGLSIQILRLSSVYGPGQSPKYIIPTMMLNSVNNKDIKIHHYKNGLQLMDFVHVKDVCKAISLACKSKSKFGIYNIASGKPITANDIADKISQIIQIHTISTSINRETNHLFYDISNAESELGFKPVVKLEKKILKEIYKSIVSKG